MKACAWRTGQIVFGRQCPEGALEIIDLPAKQCRALIDVKARHAYDGRTLLVPGVPEAENDHDAMTALIAWRDWINKPQKQGGRHEHRSAPTL